MTDLSTWLTDQVVAGDLTIGAAITVLHRGESILELDLGVDARGARVERSSLFCVRCALVKPALGLGLAALIDQGAVDPTGTIGDHLRHDELADAVGAVPMRALMEHTAGLHYTGEIAMTVVAPAARRTIAVATPAETARPGGRTDRGGGGRRGPRRDDHRVRHR